MRVFHTFKEAQNEIARDLNELGMTVHTETMQDKDIADDPDFATKELGNYQYMVLEPDINDIDGIHEEWVRIEWQDRLVGDLNPGNAYKVRLEVWEEFLEGRGKGIPQFSYTYSQRMGGHHIQKIIEELKVHPHSRQLWLPVWNATDETRRGKRRVPCSLGYWFLNRNGKLHMTYVMRSCDFITHYPNDMALAILLLDYVSEKSGIEFGTITHSVGSLHTYAKDVAGSF